MTRIQFNCKVFLEQRKCCFLKLNYDYILHRILGQSELSLKWKRKYKKNLHEIKIQTKFWVQTEIKNQNKFCPEFCLRICPETRGQGKGHIQTWQNQNKILGEILQNKAFVGLGTCDIGCADLTRD